jgi:hypothetical protein
LTVAVLTTAPVSAASSASTTGLGVAKTNPSTRVRTFAVRRLGDFGPGTLRAGFSFANSGPRRSVTIISFRVRGVIKLSRPLPGLRRATVIDGFSAPNYAGRPVVEVDFNDHPGVFYEPGSDGSLLRGLALDDATRAGVSLDASCPAGRSAIAATDSTCRAARRTTASARTTDWSPGPCPT